MTSSVNVAAICLLASTVAVGVSVATATHAAYPEKPVTFIVPWPSGDVEDVLTRMIAAEFQAEYGVVAAVVNLPGGAGGPFPGAIDAAGEPPDGYTVGSFINAIPVIGDQIGIPDLTPMPFEPLGHFLTYPFVIVASADAPYEDMAGLAAYAQRNDVSLGHFGGSLIPTKVTLAAAAALDFDFATGAVFDRLDCSTLASGHADVISTTVQLVLPCLDDVSVLASIGAERLSVTPDTPTVQELIPALDMALWNGLFVHKDTPVEVRDNIAAVAEKAVMSERAQQFARETGALVYWHGADATAAQIAKDKLSFDAIHDTLGEQIRSYLETVIK